MIASTPRVVRRAAFLLYALALFVATHWPALKVPGPPKSDLFAHLTAFGLWTSLLIAAAFFGPALSRRNILICTVIAALFAGFDEATQAIPWIRRHATIEDYLFNLIGVVLAGCGALVLARARAGNPRTQPA